jgi:hypothetical protein
MQKTTFLALASLLSCLSFFGTDQEPARAPIESPHPTSFLFHAMLEGLYDDGVANDVVDALLVTGDEVGYPRNFVYACPVCMPCIDAFRTYRARPTFLGSKTQRNTFGSGLSDRLRKLALSKDPADPLLALDELTDRWIARRFESLRLTGKQRANLTRDIVAYKEKGLAMLEQYRESEALAKHYAAMESCPLCIGAERGAMGK